MQFNPAGLGDKVEVIGPLIDLSRLIESNQVRIADRLGISWDEFYGALISFKAGEKHCRVLQAYKKDGLNLGLWVNRQTQHSG